MMVNSPGRTQLTWRGKMRQEGVITRWDDGRGFGFITPTTGGPDIFIHASAITRGPRPVVGDVVTFRTSHDDRNRLRATEVQYRESPQRRTPSTRGVRVAGLVAILFLGLLGVLAVLGFLPGLAVAVSVLFSGAAFALYRADKSAAVRGTWRVSESTLQTVSLLGGWPGALVAQQVYHHKTRKQPFQSVFWVTVVVNCAALAWLAIARRS